MIFTEEWSKEQARHIINTLRNGNGRTEHEKVAANAKADELEAKHFGPGAQRETGVHHKDHDAHDAFFRGRGFTMGQDDEDGGEPSYHAQENSYEKTVPAHEMHHHFTSRGYKQRGPGIKTVFDGHQYEYTKPFRTGTSYASFRTDSTSGHSDPAKEPVTGAHWYHIHTGEDE